MKNQNLMFLPLFTRILDPADRSPGVTLLRGLLWGPSCLFGFAAAARDRAYASGLLRSARLPARVISVGGITAGGAGKTPVTRYIARKLADHGQRVAILSRGYGRRSSGILTVSDGVDMRVSALEAGDEPYLLATVLPGVPVIVGADRVAAGWRAIRDFGATVLVLDDAFQHRRIARDLDIVVLDSAAPVGNGRFLPAGLLRESLSALRRAHVAVLTRVDQSDAVEAWRERIRAVNPRIKIVESVYRPTGLFRLPDHERLPPSSLQHIRVIALAGIANPRSFERTVQRLGATVVRPFRFPDHHPFTECDIRSVIRAAEQAGAPWIVTTMKDAARIPETTDRSRIVAVDVEVEVIRGEGEMEG